MRLASDRLAAATLVLLCLGLAASLQQSWRPNRVEDCPDRSILLELDSIPFEMRGIVRTGKRRVDGYVRGVSGQSAMPFTVRATYLQPEWLVRPTLALPGPKEPDRIERSVLEIDGESIPVVFAYEMGRGLERFTAYLFAYDREPTLSPFTDRLLDSPAALVKGVSPIDYFGISGSAHPKEIEPVKERAREWLAATWRLYRRACVP